MTARFDEYDSLLRILRRILIKNIHFVDGFSWETHFAAHSRALIVANHGPFLGPLAWVCALFPRIVDLGFGHFTYSGIAHPIVQDVPLFSRAIGYEEREGRRLRTEDYVEMLAQGRINILSVAPEGEYSLYGNGVDIQPFRSPRSIEIALRAGCPIVLLVGRGFERWQHSLSIEAPWRKWLAERFMLSILSRYKLDRHALQAARRLSLSGIFGRIPDFYVASELYHPQLSSESLAPDRPTRDRQLWEEADRVKSAMVRMLDELRRSG